VTGKRKLRYGLAAGGLLAALLAVWLWDDAAAFIRYAVNPQTHAGLFLLMFVLLPLVGFPISAFLVLIGVKFGAGYGVLITLAVMPLHLLVSFLVANSFLRSLLQRCLETMNYRLPQLPRERALWFSFVFMAVPGLPYSVKNYVLSLAGAPFRYYFLSGYLVQGAMSIPFVVAGDAVAGEHLVILAVIFIVMVLLYAMVHQLRQRHGKLLAVDQAPPPKASGKDPSQAEDGNQPAKDRP
jgi:uncharacterized membrane protein YdjX (TVP38/TMEM64 family)